MVQEPPLEIPAEYLQEALMEALQEGLQDRAAPGDRANAGGEGQRLVDHHGPSRHEPRFTAPRRRRRRGGGDAPRAAQAAQAHSLVHGWLCVRARVCVCVSLGSLLSLSLRVRAECVVRCIAPASFLETGRRSPR